MLPERGFVRVRGQRRRPRVRHERRVADLAFRPRRSAAIAPAPMTGAAICASRAMQNSNLARLRLSIGIRDSICLFVNHFGRRASTSTVSRHNFKALAIVR